MPTLAVTHAQVISALRTNGRQIVPDTDDNHWRVMGARYLGLQDDPHNDHLVCLSVTPQGEPLANYLVAISEDREDTGQGPFRLEIKHGPTLKEMVGMVLTRYEPERPRTLPDSVYRAVDSVRYWGLLPDADAAWGELADDRMTDLTTFLGIANTRAFLQHMRYGSRTLEGLTAFRFGLEVLVQLHLETQQDWPSLG